MFEKEEDPDISPGKQLSKSQKRRQRLKKQKERDAAAGSVSEHYGNVSVAKVAGKSSKLEQPVEEKAEAICDESAQKSNIRTIECANPSSKCNKPTSPQISHAITNAGISGEANAVRSTVTEDKLCESADTEKQRKLEEKERRRQEHLTKMKEKAAAAGASAESKSDSSQKSKAELKAERRAKQEEQRAAKVAQMTQQTNDSKPSNAAASPSKRQEKQRQTSANELQTTQAEKQQSSISGGKVGLFAHLRQYERNADLTKNLRFSSSSIHPEIVKVGVQYAQGVICGSNARCLALLAAVRQVILDYTTPPQKDLSRDLKVRLDSCIGFVNECRPQSVSMGNAIRQMKLQISQSPPELAEAEAKSRLVQFIERFVQEKIVLAGKAISQIFLENKSKDGDVILVYACSSLISQVLCDAHEGGRKFRVVVVDGRPKMEGREMLRRLVSRGICCSYVQITAASYVMKEVTKVMVGAHALLANGSVMSRVGTSQLALVAKCHNVPVIVCCETYKFCERVLTDSFVHNELGDPRELYRRCDDDAKDSPNLTTLNLVYDVTPADFVTVVITELGCLPCTSVPVVLRLTSTDIQ